MCDTQNLTNCPVLLSHCCASGVDFMTCDKNKFSLVSDSLPLFDWAFISFTWLVESLRMMGAAGEKFSRQSLWVTAAIHRHTMECRAGQVLAWSATIKCDSGAGGAVDWWSVLRTYLIGGNYINWFGVNWNGQNHCVFEGPHEESLYQNYS